MKSQITIVAFILTLITFAQNDTVKYYTGSWLEFGVKDTFEYFNIKDKNYQNYKLPNSFAKPDNWIKADSLREVFEFDKLDKESKKLNLKKALNIIDHSKNYQRVYSARIWCLNNYQEVFPYLISRLSKKKKVGLKKYDDTFIFDRLRTGQMNFYGHGYGIENDIFTIAGRASWILNDLTGERFVIVHIDMTKEQSEKYKQQWIEYILKLNKTGYNTK